MLDIFYFDKTIKKATIADLPKIKNKKLWIDCIDITKKEADLLKKLFKLHTVTKEDILTYQGRIKIEEFSEYIFCTFYGIEKKAHSLNTFSLDFVLGKNFIISAHKNNVESYEKLKKRSEILEFLFEKGIDILFHRLLDGEIDNFFPTLQEIDNEIESLDIELSHKVSKKLLIKILKIKKKIVEIKKVTLPQREKISFFTKGGYGFIAESSLPYFRDIYDHAIWVSDFVNNHREAVGTTFDIYMTAVSNQMNEIMKVLTVIATITIPMTVVAGIYGTNFVNIPGLKNQNGFWIMLLVLGFIMVGMIIFFKERKWF